MKISDIAIHHPTSIFTLVVVIVIGGAYFYAFALPREGMPDVQIPIITVTTTYRGVAPADMETLVTREIEKKLKGLDNLKEIRSTSSEGRSFIRVEFLPAVNIDDAMQKVRDKVEQAKGELPADADDPVLGEINVSEFPIMQVALYPVDRNGGGGLRTRERISMVRLKKLADDLADRMEEVTGVLQVTVVGGRTREIQMLIDPDRFAAYGIPITELLTLVSRENQNVSGGKVKSADAAYQVRVPGEITDPLEFYRLMIMERDGRPIYLTDVGRVRDGFVDRSDYSRFRPGDAPDARENITVIVQKRAGANVVEIADAVKDILVGTRDALRAEGVEYKLTMDMSDDVRMMVADLENNMFSGFVLVVAVVMVFMGLRNSLFVAAAIPLSMFLSFMILAVLEITLNMIVLFALILALGMLVDNAIVIVENIYRHMQEGLPRVEAALVGTREVAWPVTTSTLTTVGAFVPLLFWPGLVGEFMGYLPKTVIIVLSSSLFVALVINPVLCATLMRLKPRHRGEEAPEGWMSRAYGRVLRVVLGNRAVTILGSVAALVTAAAAFAGWGKGIEFFPETEPRRCDINIRASEGAKIERTDEITREVEEAIKDLPDIEYVTATVGSGGGNIFASGASNSNLATVSVEFVKREKRHQSSNVTMGMIRDRISGISGAIIDVAKEQPGPPTGKAVEVEISGDDVARLGAILPEVKRRIKTVPGLVDLTDDFVDARPELQFPVNRNRAGLFGLSTTWVAEYIKMWVNGIDVGDFREGDDEYDIYIRADDPYRYDMRKLYNSYVPDTEGNMIPLSSVADWRYVGGWGDVQRVDQKRVITVKGQNAEGYNATAVLDDVKKNLADLATPPGYRIRYRGQNEEMEKAQAFLGKAMVAALMVIALLLISQFNSISQPFIIMMAVVLSFIGVFGGLLLSGLAFGVIMTGIGVIGLAGVVVNNGIVLIDYTKQLEARGLDTLSAIVKAGKTRLRPVLLTAITTILGLFPMAIGVSFNVHDGTLDWASETSQFWQNMAVCVICGLAVATFLTLLVEPVLYSLFTRAVSRHRQHEAERAAALADAAPHTMPPPLPGD